VARQNINIGSTSNDGTGDSLRVAFNKINSMFTELYSETAVDSQISISGNQIATSSSNADLVLDAAGTGAISMQTIKVLMPNLPTSDPSVAGQLYNDSGTLKVSAG
tara:strand:+ start:242 stop:559 length:318 start_codon:yes stop_codon:yes gene_type:complete